MMHLKCHGQHLLGLGDKQAELCALFVVSHSHIASLMCLLQQIVLLLASSLRETTAARSADAAVPVYQWRCIVPCLTTTSSFKSLHQSSSLDSGIMSNFSLCLTFDFEYYRMSTRSTGTVHTSAKACLTSVCRGPVM